jgi:sterol desaturase/sphingolipid hydroxylase (fatty acid hydroxylase superfamily)
MLAAERFRPGRPWDSVSFWWPRALLLNAVQILMVFVVGATWDRWFPTLRLWDASALGVAGGALVGYLAITFVYYWWHRARHEVSVLWRWLHQVHHSPQRIEIITSFYKHPLEILLNGALSSFVLYVLVGVDAEAGALAVTLTGLAELFYHWNVRTPHWLGYLIQRPESHCVHHRRGWHRQNFSDLPLWDMLFGTFHNPRDHEFQCGFAEQRELQLSAMLLGRDVNPRRNDGDA